MLCPTKTSKVHHLSLVIPKFLQSHIQDQSALPPARKSYSGICPPRRSQTIPTSLNNLCNNVKTTGNVGKDDRLYCCSPNKTRHSRLRALKILLNCNRKLVLTFLFGLKPCKSPNFKWSFCISK